MDLKDGADKASLLLHIPSRFLASWWVSENGWNFPPTNNVGNISFTGQGVPDGIGVFAGVTKVYPNDVCQYDSIASGINAFVLLLELPLEHKDLTLDANMIRAVSPNARKMSEIVGQSNWAGSHYRPTDEHGVPLSGSWDGQNIFDVYYCRKMNELYGVVDKPETQVSATSTSTNVTQGYVHIVTEGETLTSIAMRYRVPLALLVSYNAISNPNLIRTGEQVKIPKQYFVLRGDSLSGIAEKYGTTIETLSTINHISNPNYIRVGQLLFV